MNDRSAQSCTQTSSILVLALSLSNSFLKYCIKYLDSLHETWGYRTNSWIFVSQSEEFVLLTSSHANRFTSARLKGLQQSSMTPTAFLSVTSSLLASNSEKGVTSVGGRGRGREGEGEGEGERGGGGGEREGEIERERGSRKLVGEGGGEWGTNGRWKGGVY